MSIRTFLGKVWLGWAGLWFVIIFLVLYPLFFIWLSTPVLYKIGHFQRRVWGVLACFPALFLPIVTKESKLPKNRRRIYCSNHCSYLDILTTGTFLPGFNFFMAKMELSKVPLFRIWFKSLDITVQRENTTKHTQFAGIKKRGI
jgi:1-acyl-sn-glycerol-3-phosphate acyltransferase